MNYTGAKVNEFSVVKSAKHTTGEHLALQRIGKQLDNNIFPRIKNGGIVMPSEIAVQTPKLGKETCYVRPKQRRPKTRPWSRTSGRQRKARRSWPPREAAPVVRTDIQAKYADEVATVYEAYPNTQIWHQADGLWLLTESSS